MEQKLKPGRKIIAWLAALLSFLLIAAAIVVYRYMSTDIQMDSTARATSPVDIAPVPLPTSIPLIGENTKSTDGYPDQYVDRAAMRSLLLHGRYRELTEYVEFFQSAFEKNNRFEYWILDAIDALSTGEEQLLPLLNEWVKAYPESFAPYLVRGSFRVSEGFLLRGGKYITETPEENISSMNKALAKGEADLKKALKLRPALVAARRAQIKSLSTRDKTRSLMREALDQALAVCPSCFQIRVTYIYTLRPRWGGSYEEMANFASQQQNVGNPRMRLLPGYVDLDKADILRENKNFSDALAANDLACARGDNWEFLLSRGITYASLKKFTDAMADFNRALELRPGSPDILEYRAWTYLKTKRYEQAGRDLLSVLRVNPIAPIAFTFYDAVVQGLRHEGLEYYKEKRAQDALRLYDLAKELAPLNRDVQREYAMIIVGPKKQEPENVETLKTKAQANPNDFRALQKLDYTLAREGKYDQVIVLWTDFLKRNPSHGQAYLERGGAYFQLRKLKEAMADAQKACDLGVTEGCARSKQLRGK